MLEDGMFKEIVNSADIGIVVAMEESYQILYSNSKAREILGYLDSFAFDLPQLFPEMVRREPPMASQDLLPLEGHLEDIMMCREDQSVLVAAVSLRRIQRPDRKLVLLIFRDVSHQRRLEREIDLKQRGLREALKELSEQNQSLAQLDEAKTRFIYLITHELRTPLTALISSAEFLVAGLHQTEEDEKLLKNTVFSQSTMLLEMVNSVLDLTRLKAGTMEYYLEELSPIKVVQAVLQNFKDLASQKEVSFRLTLGEGSLNCYFDPVRLRQVVSNIVSNAIKFCSMKSTIEVELRTELQFVEISIQDQGIGIPESQHHLIFAEFSVLSEMRTHSQGTGLGLAISRNIVEAMGGTLRFKSQENVGTTFIVRLPKGRVCSEIQYRTRQEGIVNLMDETND